MCVSGVFVCELVSCVLGEFVRYVSVHVYVYVCGCYVALGVRRLGSHSMGDNKSCRCAAVRHGFARIVASCTVHMVGRLQAADEVTA